MHILDPKSARWWWPPQVVTHHSSVTVQHGDDACHALQTIHPSINPWLLHPASVKHGRPHLRRMCASHNLKPCEGVRDYGFWV